MEVVLLLGNCKISFNKNDKQTRISSQSISKLVFRVKIIKKNNAIIFFLLLKQ